MSPDADPSPKPTHQGAPAPVRRRVRLMRRRPRDTRRARRVFAGSLGFHLLLLSCLAWVPISRALVGKAGQEARIEVATSEPADPFEVQPEPERRIESEPPEATPELVEQALPPEPAPPEPIEPLPVPLDDRPQLVDPLSRVAAMMFATRRPEPAQPVDPAPVVVPTVEAPQPRPVASPPAEPQVLDGPEPGYPRAARRLGQQGSVTLRALVSRDGLVTEVELISSSGHERLDKAAGAAFLEWRFRAWQAGEPEQRSFRKTFTFVLP